MKVRLNISIAGALVTFLLAVGIYIALPYCIAEAPSTSDVGPRAFPQLLCILIAILSAVQLLLVFTKKMPSKYKDLSLKKYGKPLLAMGLAFLTALLSYYLSVVAVAMVCSIAYLILLKAKDWRGYAAVLVTGGLLYTLMRFALHIRF